MAATFQKEIRLPRKIVSVPIFPIFLFSHKSTPALSFVSRKGHKDRQVFYSFLASFASFARNYNLFTIRVIPSLISRYPLFLAKAQRSQSFLFFLGVLCVFARNYNLFTIRVSLLQNAQEMAVSMRQWRSLGVRNP